MLDVSPDWKILATKGVRWVQDVYSSFTRKIFFYVGTLVGAPALKIGFGTKAKGVN